MINEEEVEWALRLWNSLIVGDEKDPIQSGGTWQLEGVGKYVRTALKELTLTEIHLDRHTPSEESRSLFDEHDYIATLGREIGWSVKTQVSKAYNYEGEFSIPEDRIGDVMACQSRCGAIARVEPLDHGVVYYKLEDGQCPVCGEPGFVDDDWLGLHVVIDDRGATLKRLRQEEE